MICFLAMFEYLWMQAFLWQKVCGSNADNTESYRDFLTSQSFFGPTKKLFMLVEDAELLSPLLILFLLYMKYWTMIQSKPESSHNRYSDHKSLRYQLIIQHNAILWDIYSLYQFQIQPPSYVLETAKYVHVWRTNVKKKMNIQICMLCVPQIGDLWW